MNENKIRQSYEMAKERYATLGVNTDQVLEELKNIKISINCWQGDDVKGFLFPDQELSGGISVSGNYPGRARNPEELKKDLSKALSLIPGNHKVQLHAIYADTTEKVDLDELEPRHFQAWVDWAKEERIALDFNGTFFSHPNSESGFTLSSPDPGIRDFWIEHGKRSRKISEYFGKELGERCINNFWIPDGYKDHPIDKAGPRLRLMEALDEVMAEELDEKYTMEAVEGKLFGTGVESFTVGSNEFYMAYALTRGKLWTIDAGHFHPTEDVSDKFSAFLPFGKGLMLHVSRPVRWDSDHVVIMDDALLGITKSLVWDGYLDKVNIGLDFFDASINRIAAWIIGTRSTLKGLLSSLLTPVEELKKTELEGDYTKRLALTEELKSYPFGAVWDYYCLINNVPVGEDWLKEVVQYEKDVLSKRN